MLSKVKLWNKSFLHYLLFSFFKLMSNWYSETELSEKLSGSYEIMKKGTMLKKCTNYLTLKLNSKINLSESFFFSTKINTV